MGVVMARPDDVVGYVFKADLYCTEHIFDRLPVGPSEDFDGWALAWGSEMPTEQNLDEIAAAFGIDRGDESSFDSDYFPKVVFRDQANDDDRCGTCGVALKEG
jgi:hypothetical protein